MYVERQLSTARWAMNRGSIGAARAALRVLSGEDFDAAQEASSHLRTVRNHAAEKEDLVVAMRQLCALAARAPVPAPGAGRRRPETPVGDAT
jgi:hypothetical protein